METRLFALFLSALLVCSSCAIAQYPTNVNGIELGNSSSLLKKIQSPLFVENESDQFPKLVLCNRDSTQILTLFSYPGSSKNDVSYFVVELVNSKTDLKNSIKVDDLKFLTDLNLTIGCSRDDVITKYSKAGIDLNENELEPGKTMTFTTDDENMELLKKHNMPLYTVRYTFEANKIVKLEFGFVYP